MARTLVSSVPAALTGNALPLPSFTTAQRDSIVSPAEGTAIYNTDADRVEIRKATAWEASASVPVGTILPWIGGYFTGAGNAGFTSVLGNTVAAVNTLLNQSGYYVCDGSALNLATSAIFNGAGRRLPDLTDSRFLQGSTVAGGIGGQTSVTLAEANLPSHRHYISVTSDSTGNSTANGVYVAGDGHVHWPGTNYYNMHATYEGDASSNDIWWRETDSEDWSRTMGVNETTGGATLQVYGAAGVNSTGLEITGYSGGNHTNTYVPNHSYVPSHSHPINAWSNYTGSGTSYDNRPQYLSVLYIMRAI